MDTDVELGFVDNAAILKMASLKMVSLPHLLQMPTPLLVICTHCEITLVPQSAIHHSKIIYSFYKYNLISLYNFFPNPIRHLSLYNIEDYSCKKSKDMVDAFLRYALIEQRHL